MTERAYKMSDDEWQPEFAGRSFDDIAKLAKSVKREQKKKNARKMVVDGAGLKTLTIVVKHKGKKK